MDFVFNEEFVISNCDNKFFRNVFIYYCINNFPKTTKKIVEDFDMYHIKEYYYCGNKSTYCNNGTARKKLKEEEILLIDVVMDSM